VDRVPLIPNFRGWCRAPFRGPLCDGIDVAFSSVGITKQEEGLTFKDVAYRGNVDLLEAAHPARVTKFIYVSVFWRRNPVIGRAWKVGSQLRT
jgi:hypothetical protein